MNARPVLCGAAVLLLLFPASHYAGGIKELTSAGFSAGTGENFEIRDGNLTLLKQWSFSGQGDPVARSHFGFAFNETSETALLFGGKDGSGNPLGDTWLWAAGAWTQKNPAGAPGPRYGHALVWAGDKFLLFGGNSAGDTWTYDIAADTWTNITAALSPSTRNMPAMAYDPDFNQVILFGGGVGDDTWSYDVAAATWSILSLPSSPPDRSGASMSYDKLRKKMILFGGKTPAESLLDDTWAFDAAAQTWTDLNPVSKPAARWQGAAAYDPLGRSVFLYGGFTSGYTGDLWYYDFPGNKWSQDGEAPYPEATAGRYAHGLIYDTPGKRAVIFGGIQDITVRSLWSYRFMSSATWTSSTIDSWAGYSSTAAVTWDTISAIFSDKPDRTGALLQIASSVDGVSYDSFKGPDGATSTFYPAGAPVAVWAGHNNRRYIKLQAYLSSGDPPARAKIQSLRAAYNRAPSSPVLVSPTDGGLINDATPLFRWSITSDPDGDLPLLYQIQASTDQTFAALTVSSENLSMEGSFVSFTPETALAEGLWYWRARAKDPAGLYGGWSVPFSVALDTHTPPGPVTIMTAVRGPAINSAALTWTFPGDDKGRVDGGAYRVRYSALGEILTEGDWSAASSGASGLFSAAPGDAVITQVPGLPDGTTIFFAVKTEDEVGNLSPLSTVSPFIMTDSSPTVVLLSPNGGEFAIGNTTLTWTAADPNPGDYLTASLFLSSDSGAGYTTLIASGLAPGVTSYLWDSAQVVNGTAYRVKVTIEDQRGLSASDASDNDFRAENTNNTPSVYFTSAPASGEEIAGLLNISWAVSDLNPLDTHTYRVYLSINSGASYALLAGGLVQTSYTIDTRTLANLATYRIRIVAADSGSPQLSGAAQSPVFSVVNTLPPKQFTLIKPVEETLPSVFDLSFSWEPALDPEGGAVTYTLQYSTTAGPVGGITVAGLVQPAHTPTLNSLLPDREYFWKVTAEDQYAKRTDSPSGRFTLYSVKARSTDGLLLLEIISGMPAQGHIAFRDARSSLGDSVQMADRDLLGNRTVKMLAAPVWDARVQDINGNILPSGGVSARLTFTSPGQNRPAGTDAALADIQHLRIAKLDESANRWRIQPLQTVDAGKKQVAADVNGLSVFSVMAALTSAETLSGLTAFPNPFAAGREIIRIRYTLAGDSDVRIRIYTPLGDLVRVLDCPAGTPGCGEDGAAGLVNEMDWDGKNGAGRTVANGMYTAEVYAKSASRAGKELIHIGVLK